MAQIFGFEHPIMLAGMNWITEPKLVSAVCNAGGLGILAIAGIIADSVGTGKPGDRLTIIKTTFRRSSPDIVLSGTVI